MIESTRRARVDMSDETSIPFSVPSSIDGSIPNRSIHNRREFLRRAGLAGGALACGAGAQPLTPTPTAVSLVLNSTDAIARAAPVLWASQELTRALVNAGIAVTRRERVEDAPANEFCVIVSGTQA